MSPLHLAALLPLSLAGVGVLWQGASRIAVDRRFHKAPTRQPDGPAVTLLKPLYGDEPRLAENLATFLAQDYNGLVQMVLGINGPDDAARTAAEALIAAHPDRDITLCMGPRLPGANGKMGNLAAMLPHARHAILILSDSDMVVERDYLSTVVAALEHPGVGIATCLYVGRGDAGVWSQIGAAMIAYQQTPAMIFALAHDLAQPCMGSTIAIRRETLDAIGGFAAFADVLADDYAMGAAVRARGLGVAVPAMLITHAGDEASAGQLWRHFLRWAATVRDLNPGGHYGSVVTMPVPLAGLGWLMWPNAGIWALAGAVVMRRAVMASMDRAAGRPIAPFWATIAGDIIGFCVFCVSLLARKIDWRGEKLTMGDKGRIRATPQETGAPHETLRDR